MTVRDTTAPTVAVPSIVTADATAPTGAVVTLVLSRSAHFSHFVVFLPGLWSLFYGLGTVASLPYLPRLAGCVAVWHLVAGVLLLHLEVGPTPSGWCVGAPFGVGQLLAAGVLYTAEGAEIEP